MNIEEAREYCLSLKKRYRMFSFQMMSRSSLKWRTKMFALLPLDGEEPYLALKCNPDYTEELRDRYAAVEGAYHFNKEILERVYLERDMSDDDIRHWIRHSYREVIAKLPKKIGREAYDE